MNSNIELSGGTFPGSELMLGIILSCAYIALAYLILVRVYKKAVRSRDDELNRE